jgi:NADH-quinone oxidoreductase subunit C
MSKLVLEALDAQFPDAIVEMHSQFGDDTAVVDPAAWRDIARFLRDDPRTSMSMFIDLTAVDYLNIQLPRFEVVCHLRSLERGHRVRIKARVGDEDGANADIDSLVPVWKGANWFEREAFDLMGITFRGHPDLRRILMYPEFVGHPLRKDYPVGKIQPLVPFRKEAVDKLPPFREDEGKPFGRQVHDFPRGEETPGGSGSPRSLSARSPQASTEGRELLPAAREGAD